MEGFTDIHCHVLPGLDDGADSIRQSVEMLRIMYDEGIDNAFLTPHYHGGHVEPSVEMIDRAFEAVLSVAEEDEILSGMKLYKGCEIYYYPSVTEWLSEGKVLTLAGSDYVLLEFGYRMDLRTLSDAVTAVVNAGYRPIVAHAERYECLTKNWKDVRILTERGAYIQINSEAFFSGRKIRSFVKKLMKNDLVSFVATDAHDTGRRAPGMADAAAYIIKRFGDDRCRRILIDNPAKVIANEYISDEI